MKLAITLSILFTFILLSCSQPKSKQAINPDDITFADYLKSLDTIPLPFSLACSDSNFKELSTHFDSTGFKKFKDYDSARPMGILFNDDKNIVVVNLVSADYCVAPILISFDKTGRKLDKLDVYGHSFLDSASSSMPYFKVTKDKRIVVIDTAKQWKLDTASNIVDGSIVVKIDSIVYALSESGKFIKLAQKK